MLLLNVCRAWTAIALSTPDLWTTVHIDFPCAAGLTQLLPIWFQRAGNRPLSMYLSGDFGEVDHRVFSVICRLGAQLKRLEICDNMPKELLYDWDCDDDNLDDDDLDDDAFGWNSARHGFIDLFGSTTPGPLPLLETLTFRGLTKRWWLGLQVLQLLRLAPNLVECVFARLETVDGLDVPSKTLSDDEILNVLTLPALENLSLAMRISGDDLFSFFQRSAPPLRELVVGLMIEQRNAGLHKCLRLIPTLTSPSLLPNLLSLVLHVSMWPAGVISDSSWTALLRELSTRRFRLHFIDVEPPPSILAGFRDLVLEGVEV
ncbi:hypothetical protein K438DRAFT_1991835 [Mycena galopus ATCC 62051]|nr:hypothetical protein K438DRAFT_1991835 [Mycena galopus ATCC 62051]